MAGNSQRRGAVRKPGTKKGPTVGSGGVRRRGLEGRGATPRAEQRPHHPAAKKAAKAARQAQGRHRKTDDTELVLGRNPVVECLRAKVPATALYVALGTEADERLTERVDQLTAAVQAIAQRMDKMDGRMGNMEGTMLEWKFERNLGNWLREWVRRPRKVFTDDLTKLDDAVAAGQIADVEVSQVAWSDALVRALDLDTQQEVVLSIELSTTVNEDDVERASFRAGILRRAGYDGRSFVAGHGISKQAQQLAGATGTTVVLVRPDP